MITQSQDNNNKDFDQKSALAQVSGLAKHDQLPRNFVGKTGKGQATVTPPAKISIKNSLNEILVFARLENVSDVHLCVDHPILFRRFGTLYFPNPEKISAERIQAMIEEALDAERLAEFKKRKDLEFVYIIEGAGRFRVTLMHQRLGWDFAARLIPQTIATFENSGMTKACRDLTKWSQGMVLVTGPVSCGKTSTLAILVEMINQTRFAHIITMEDPIEIVYEPKKCQITQREMKLHSLSQANALRAALREDPDIIVVSELRDLDTIQLAVSAAETGHLVLGTMNTDNAAQTISRLIDSFPADEQAIIRKMISESLRGVICQQLIPRIDNSGVEVAYEILIVNSAVANMIREGKQHQLGNIITTGRSSGMVLFDHSLKELVKKGLISTEEACSRAINPVEFKQYLSMASASGSSEWESIGENSG